MPTSPDSSMSVTVSSPLSSLVRLIQIALDPPTSSPPPPSLTDEFGRFINRHRLGPFLFHHLPSIFRASLPLPLQKQLSRTANHTTRRALIRNAALINLGQKLTAESIPWLTVKGPVLASSLWQDPGKRHAGDVDIVIHPHSAAKADSLLHSLGFRRTTPDFELTPRQWDQYLIIKYEFGYQSTNHPELNIEIKWRLEGIENLAAILDRPHHTLIGEYSIPTLPPAINFRYLCHHGARHGWARLFWLVDVARLIQENSITWSDVLPRSEAEPSYRPVAQAVGLVRQLFDLAPPQGLLPSPASSDATIAWLQAQAIRQMSLEASELSSTSEWLRQLRYRTRLEPGRQGIVSALRPHIHSPLNWKTLPLSDRWFALYCFISPFLWIYRLVTRSK